jgi:hypothetical protein
MLVQKLGQMPLELSMMSNFLKRLDDFIKQLHAMHKSIESG